MKRRMPHIISCLFFLLLSFVSFSQTVTVKAAINRNKILIGEPIELKIEATVPTGTEVSWFPLDSMTHFEFIEKGKIDTIGTADGKTYRQTLLITSFDSGRWVFPSLPLVSGNKAYLTDSLPVSVAYSNFNPQQDYHDIKDILDVPNPNTGYIDWVLRGLVPGIGTGLSFISSERKVPGSSTAGDSEESRTETAAFAGSAAIAGSPRKTGLGEEKWRGQKPFCTQLETIFFRRYLYRRAGLPAMEEASGELMLQLRRFNLPGDAFTRLAQTLRMGDAVKFAKYQPGIVENEDSLSTVRQSIGELDKIISS